MGDYPAVKWRHYADALPADMRGKSVLDIGCNAGFFSLAMKRRGAERVLGIDWDERYLAQARFAAEVEGLDIAFERMSVYDVGALRERFDVVFFLGVFYHLRHPLLALDLVHAHAARDVLVFQTMQRGSGAVARVETQLRLRQTAPFDLPGFPKCISSSMPMRMIRQLVGAQPGGGGGDAAERGICDREPARNSETYICRQIGGSGAYGAVYPARGEDGR